MIIHYDVPKINMILDDFYRATGVRIDLFNTAFLPISSSHHEMCRYCQSIQGTVDCRKRCAAFDTALLQKSRDSRTAERAVCPFGLTNVVSPIFWETTIIGYLFFGQMKTEPSCPDPDREKDYADVLPFDAMQIEGITHLAEILIGHILTENLLKPDADELLQRTVAFIHNNLENDLSIKTIAKRVNASKSVLYSKFHACFHCTLGEYINRKRIEKSVDLLRNTNLSMEEIALVCGFSSASYFTKTFKQQRGTTPFKFRKSQL